MDVAEIIIEVVKIGGAAVLPFLVGSFIFWRTLTRFWETEQERHDELVGLLEESQEVIDKNASAMNSLAEKINE